MRKKKIGNKTFHVSGGVVTATDPCYERDLLCHRTIRNVKDGDYTCYAWRFLSDTYNENGEVVGRATTVSALSACTWTELSPVRRTWSRFSLSAWIRVWRAFL